MFNMRWAKHAISVSVAMTLSFACLVTSVDAGASTTSYFHEISADTFENTDSSTTEVDTDTTETEAATTSAITITTNFKKIGIAKGGKYINIRSGASSRAKVRARLYKGSAVTLLSSKKGGWVKVKSGSIKGYVNKKLLATGSKAKKLSSKYGTKYINVKSSVGTLTVYSDNDTTSDELTTIKSGKSYKVIKEYSNGWIKISANSKKGYINSATSLTAHYTFKKAVSLSKVKALLRRSSKGYRIATYAQRFVGNRYVYGGTSLTHGTDCSGFTMSVYKSFGIKIPRTSRQQATVGKRVSLSNLKPGDLLFYKNGSSIGHVAMYIGNGKIVHASTAKTGIKISRAFYRRPACARRIVNS